MPITAFAPKYREDPNAKVHSAYVGVAQGGGMVTRITTVSQERDRLESTKSYGPGIPRGQGGMIATLILGGMVTTLDEIKEAIEAVREQKFQPERTPGDIAAMCRKLMERKIERTKYLRKNPSETPRPQSRPGLFLPRGYRMVPTTEPGFSVRVRV